LDAIRFAGASDDAASRIGLLLRLKSAGKQQRNDGDD
jgi:hypothetical protein